MVPNELYSDLMSHIVLYDDVKRYIIEQVSLRQSTEKKTVKGNGYTASGQTVPVPMDTSHVSNFYCEDVASQPAEEHPAKDKLLTIKNKDKKFKSQCFHCHQYGINCLSAPRKTWKWAKQAELTDSPGKKGKVETRDHMDLG